MEFYCEGLPQHGVVLIPPSSPEYDSLLADIQQRIGHDVDEHRGTSAILVNRSSHAIVAIQQLWTFKKTSGRTAKLSTGPGPNPSVLLPFGLSEKHLKLYGYWHLILPGSKRLLSAQGRLIGDNGDVRPPQPDEVWTGGTIGGGGGSNRLREPVDEITLTLDGVFFEDGSFAGPNREGLFERVVAVSEAHLRVAGIARKGLEDGLSAERLFEDIEVVTGRAPGHPSPPPPPPPHVVRTPETDREWSLMLNGSALRRVAFWIARSRRVQGDTLKLAMIRGWGDLAVPHFRRL